MNKFGRIALKTILWIIGSIIGLVLLLFILIRIPSIQNFAIQQVVSFLEKKIETPVKIERVSLDLPKLIVLEGVYFEDQKQDTLLSGDLLKVDISLLKLLNNKVEINEIDLRGITAKIDRTLPDSTFNFDYIIDAFVSDQPEEPKPEDTTAAMEFSIEKINLDRIHLVYKDAVIGSSADFNLGHFDTRIKTFDLNNMRYEIPKINIKGIRSTIKQWAVAAADSLNAPSPALATQDSTVAPVEMPDVAIDHIDVADVDVNYEDQASALSAKILFEKLLVDFKSIDLKGERVNIDRVQLDNNIAKIAFGKTSASPAPLNTADTTAVAEPMNWKVSIGDLAINNNKLAYFDANTPRISKGMDYGNIDIDNFNFALNDFFFAMDSISGRVDDLRFKDRSGLAVKQLQTDFAYTEHGVTLGNLYLETPHTLIQDYVKATYPSLETITDHIGEIGIDANIRKSKLGMQDVLLLVPDLDTMEVMQPLLTRTFYIDGKVNGRVDDLRIPTISFSTLDQTKLLASAHIKGLPDVDKLYADLQLKNFTTGKRDIDRLVAKNMMPDSLELPARMALRGTFKGGMNRFATQMHLLTNMGNADLKATYHAAKDTAYDAQLAISDIDVGRLMKMDSTLGKVSFAANIKGVGLNPKKAIADIEAKLISAEAMGYTYKDIVLDAQAEAGQMKATLNSDDPNIRLNMNALANFQDRYPTFNMEFLVDSINTKNLNLTSDSIRYHGKLIADFDSADPDYLNGRFDITNSIVAFNNSRYVLDTISLIARSDTSQNLLLLRSEFLTAHMIGAYKLTSLGSAFQDALATYYNPAGTDAVAVKKVQDTIPAYDPVQLEFGMTFRRSPLIIKMLPELTEMEPITFDGNFNSDEKSINLKGVAPHALYSGTQIDNVGIDLNTLDSTLYYAVLVNKLKVSTIELTNTLLSGTIQNNVVDAGLWVKDPKGKEQYHIGLNLLAEAEDYIFRLKENGLMLNYEQWQVNPNNAIYFGKKGLLAKHFDLDYKGQRMRVDSKDSTYNAPLELNFDNFRIETFTNLIESNTFVIGGGINGNALVDRLDTSPVFTSDITINDFYFGQDTIGNINLQVNNVRENTFAADIRITENGNDIRLNGDYISPPNAPSSMDFVLDVNNLSMHTLEAFSFGNLRRTSGSIKGRLDITGTPDAPRINGDLLFDQAKMNISMLNATFSMDQQRIQFNNRGLSFDQFTLMDSIGNKAIIDGNIRTRTYTDFAMGLDIKADDFQVLNSTEKDNKLFYGQLNIDADMDIRGGLTNPNVNGTLRVNENTNMTLTMPETDPGLVDREGIVEFTSLTPRDSAEILAVEDTTEGPSNTIVGMNISLNIDVDRNAAFNVIVDPGTGDKLFVKGQALLNFGIEPGGEMSLAGTYEVEEGNYSLSFNMIKRRFDFRKGSTITWGGDIMDAQLNLAAIYRLQAQPIDLVQNQVAGTQSNYYRQRLPFEVILNIGGEMMKPEISFDIDMGEGGNASTIPQFVTQTVESRLAQIRENPSEVNKQTFALIVLGRFIAENPFQSAGGSSTETMVRSSVSSLLTSQLNKLAGDLIAGVELNFDLQSTADDYSTGQAQTRTDLNVGLSKRLLNDRLKVTVGSNFELEGAQQPGQKASNIAGDISVEYQLSRDGRYIARAYRKNEYQVTLQGQFIETGLGFIINMNYDEFKELFMGAKRLQQLNEERQKELKEKLDLDEPRDSTGRRRNNSEQENTPSKDTDRDDTKGDAQSFDKAYHRDDEEVQATATERGTDD